MDPQARRGAPSAAGPPTLPSVVQRIFIAAPVGLPLARLNCLIRWPLPRSRPLLDDSVARGKNPMVR